jgi:flagellar biosynthesis GTPase FlhF
MLYTSQVDETSRRKITILSLGGSSKLNSLCELHDIEITHAVNPGSVNDFVVNESSRYDLILVDIGEIGEDLKSAMLMRLPENLTGHYFCANARYKLSELVGSYNKLIDQYPLRSVIVTMCDESFSIGNILSFCNQMDISLLFFSSGRNMSRGLHPANGAYTMSLFHGFSLDFKSMWENADKGGLLD